LFLLDSPRYPLRDRCAYAVSGHAVLGAVAHLDAFAVVTDSPRAMVVGPTHEAHAFRGREAADLHVIYYPVVEALAHERMGDERLALEVLPATAGLAGVQASGRVYRPARVVAAEGY
jgi:hypothetical protein